MSLCRWVSLVSACALVSLACHDYHIDFSEKQGEIRLFDDLYSVAVTDDQRAVAVGYYGAAYWTEDGGQTWHKGTTDSLASLYSVAMADPQYGWAVGQQGLILRTEDGGRSWKEQPNLKQDEGFHLFSVTAIDRQTAWAVGTWGTRIKTEDGGKTWVDHSFTIDTKHPMFVWLSPVEQEKVRSGGKVYDDVSINDVDCLPAPSTRCWLIGEFGYIYYSDDSGATWQSSTIAGSVELEPVRIGYNEIEISEDDRVRLTEFAVQISDQEHLNVAIEPAASAEEIRDFSAGMDGDRIFELFEVLEARAQEVRAVLEDAGILSDRLRMRGQPPWDYEDFIEDDPEFLDRYFEARRLETGAVKVRVIQNPNLFTVRFQDANNGMIAGLGGVMLTSDDGGVTWRYRETDRTQALFSVSANDGRAVAVGEKGLIRMSTDGGATWAVPPEGTIPAIYTFLRDVDFDPSGRVGYMVGQSGQILRSTDAGYEWSQVLPPAS